MKQTGNNNDWQPYNVNNCMYEMEIYLGLSEMTITALLDAADVDAGCTENDLHVSITAALVKTASCLHRGIIMTT